MIYIFILKNALIIKCLFVLISDVTFAKKVIVEGKDNEAFSLGEATYFGSGCPDGSVMSISSSDGDSLAVLFSDYIAETSDEERRVRKSCNLAIPVEVSEGYALGIVKIEYRGYTFGADKSLGSYSKFLVEYFFAGEQGPKYNEKYQEDKNVYIENNLELVTYSKCGANTNLRVNTSIMAYKKKEGDQDVDIGIDSTDVTLENELRYYLTTKKCS